MQGQHTTATHKPRVIHGVQEILYGEDGVERKVSVTLPPTYPERSAGPIHIVAQHAMRNESLTMRRDLPFVLTRPPACLNCKGTMGIRERASYQPLPSRVLARSDLKQVRLQLGEHGPD